MKTKPKRLGRPPKPPGTKARVRPIITKTTVSQATLDTIRAEHRPAGRVIDDMRECYVAVKTCASRRGISEVQVIAGLTQ